VFKRSILTLNSHRTIRRLAGLAAVAGVALALTGPAGALGAGATAHPSDGNAVTHWNAVATDAFAPTEGTNPMEQSRTLAILHAAIHDALNAIDPRFEAYTPGLTPAPGASIDAAVAAAAHGVLTTLVPGQAALVDAAYGRALTAIPEGPARSAGIALGEASARATLSRRQGDGLETAGEPAYAPGSGPGEYQYTPPFDFAAKPGWGRVRPFVIELAEHGVGDPQPLASEEYAEDLAYVRAIGEQASPTRTAEESEIARFWYEDSPLGWNRIANTVVRQRELDAWSAARALALVNFAMADGFIAGFEAKYRYRFWRPETAIRDAAEDGNPRTEPDPSWRPLLPTPPVPDHPSTHTVLGWAAAQVLIELLGDEAEYSATSLTLPGVTRGFERFSEAADENGMSRLYAGIHFRHAVEHGRRQGQSIGRAVVAALEPIRAERRSELHGDAAAVGSDR